MYQRGRFAVTENRQPIRFYTEDELDEIEAQDPERAYRLARAQAMAQRQTPFAPVDVTNLPPPDPDRVAEAVESVRQILSRDGGDIELVGIENHVVLVRMKGACVGCPNSVLDLQNVVARIVRGVPGVSEVRNTF